MYPCMGIARLNTRTRVQCHTPLPTLGIHAGLLASSPNLYTHCPTHADVAITLLLEWCVFFVGGTVNILHAVFFLFFSRIFHPRPIVDLYFCTFVFLFFVGVGR